MGFGIIELGGLGVLSHMDVTCMHHLYTFSLLGGLFLVQQALLNTVMFAKIH